MRSTILSRGARRDRFSTAARRSRGFSARTARASGARHARLAAVTVLAALALSAVPARSFAETVRVGFYPSRERGEVTRAAKAFCAYVAEATGLAVEPVVAANYTEGVNALTNGSVDIAWLSPFSVVLAEAAGRSRVVLKSVRRDEPFYWGAVVVRKDSGISTIEGLRGKRFGWTDPTSTAGHLVTKAALIRAGLRPEKDFASNQFLGGHDRLVRAVLDGTVDAGATFANGADAAVGAWTVYLSPEEAEKITAIFTTEPIPGDAIAASEAFVARKKGIAERVSTFLAEMGGDPKGKALLRDLYDVDKLVPAESKDYDGVRLAVEALRQGP